MLVYMPATALALGALILYRRRSVSALRGVPLPLGKEARKEGSAKEGSVKEGIKEGSVK